MFLAVWLEIIFPQTFCFVYCLLRMTYFLNGNCSLSATFFDSSSAPIFIANLFLKHNLPLYHLYKLFVFGVNFVLWNLISAYAEYTKLQHLCIRLGIPDEKLLFAFFFITLVYSTLFALQPKDEKYIFFLPQIFLYNPTRHLR